MPHDPNDKSGVTMPARDLMQSSEKDSLQKTRSRKYYTFPELENSIPE
jgi:hypothetical protein